VFVSVGGAQVSRAPLTLEPLGVRGEAIFPAFEGWGPDKNGDNLLLLGYYNRNKSQEFDIPIGPDNQIEPGGPDYGQPTHFYTSRQHGVFAIKVPKDFGNRKLTWTITANGQTSAVSFWLNPPYWIGFYKHLANGNEPPVIRFSMTGPTLTGPPVAIAQTLEGAVGRPVPLTLWASDSPEQESAKLDPKLLTSSGPIPSGSSGPASVAVVGGQVIGGARAGSNDAERGAGAPDITVNWKKHRAPRDGDVRFAKDSIPLVTKGDPKLFLEATTTATFSAPGEYVIRAQVNDQSGDGGGGDQCCWTTAHVRVNVK
jgi:hypothetical protein